VQQDNVLAIFNSIGTDNVLAVQPLLNQLGVPELFSGTGASRAADPKHFPWTVPYLPSFTAEGAIDGRSILATRPKARVAVLQENSDYGKDLTAGLKRGLGSKRIVALEGYELTDTNVSAQIAKLKAAKADTLMVFATPQFTIQAFLAAAKLGWHPQFYVGSVSIEPTVMKIVTASTTPKFAEGALSIAFIKDPTNAHWAKDPSVPLYRRIMAKYDPQGRPSDAYNFYGMAVAFTMVDTLKHAGRNLTRESLLKAATHLNESDNPFLLPGMVLRTSPTDYYPMDQVQSYRYHNGLWTPQGPLVQARS
jgi:branched-chain amino acid transport system substrate-binding protein